MNMAVHLFIAATGLGKTVIGAEITSRTQLPGRANRTILIAPDGVRENWEQQLENRNIYFKFFNIDVLFRKASDRSHHQSTQLEKLFQRANHDTVIIIDEAHFYRNKLLREKSKRGKSLVYKRILPAVKAGAKIFLLTATAYSTNFSNLNSLLYLLPHRFFNPNLFNEQSPWEIYSADEFSHLPVVTILGLPHVLKMARDRGDIDSNGRTFIQFGEERRYLPKTLKLYPVSYQLFLQSKLQSAFDSRCFDQASKFPQTWFDDEKMAFSQSAIDTVYNSSLASWLSSPIAMARSIEQNLATLSEADRDDVSQLALFSYAQQSDNELHTQEQVADVDEQKDAYDTLMHMPLEERSNILTPLLEKLKQENYEDEKLRRLQEIVEEHCINRKSKAIIFVKRHLTAQYLLNALEAVFDQKLCIGCTVEIDEINPRLKASPQRSAVLKQFSPRSHCHKASQEYNILICTDADGVGVNLQDADAVINYDPPEGADELFQRVGRVLSMTIDSERVIHLYTFTPSILNQNQTSSRVQSDICRKFDRLKRCHSKSRRILGSGVMSEETAEVTFEDDLDVEHLTRDSLFLEDVGGLGTESVLSHTSVLEQFRSRAEALPEYLLSARSYPQSQPRMFVLLQHKDAFHPVLFNLLNRKLEKQDDFTILDLIACTESEPRAAIQAVDIERLANQAVCAWCEAEKIQSIKLAKFVDFTWHQQMRLHKLVSC
jgi:superfamily II DNA or RNA helicase